MSTSVPRLAWAAARFGGIAYCVNTFVFECTQCQGPSMLPTFRRSGDLLLVDKLTWRFTGLERDMVITANSPHVADQKVCKRVIALEGDVVRLGTGEVVTVPKGHVWLEGDNPLDSTDSRYYGPVPISMIQGRVTHRVWPFNLFKKVDRVVPTDPAQESVSGRDAKPRRHSEVELRKGGDEDDAQH